MFPAVGGREVVARFDGGNLTSDAGMLLLAAADRRVGIIDALARSFSDNRQASKVRHPLADILSERVFAIAAGYEDANDLDMLRFDPALKVACNRLPEKDLALASQPTISRLENSVGVRDLIRMGQALAERVIAQLPVDTKQVVLDVDATDDPCHGQQEFEFFNRYYDTHCYLPLLLHVTAEDGRQRLLGSLLRPGKASYKTGLFWMLRTAVRLLRCRFPDIVIVLRADAGFGFADVLKFCEKHVVQYVLGLRGNRRLTTLSTPIQMDACLKHRFEGDGCLEYGEFEYKAGSWPRKRRVIVKAEITNGELNPRYVVTDLEQVPEAVYLFYCGRGEQENRIKELKLDLSSGRTSCHRFLANQLRLLLHSAACVLMTSIQDAAAETKLAKAQVCTLRLRLLKVAARVVETCRRIWFHLPTSCPDKDSWEQIYRKLCPT
jgi:hypothetical protein